jgi:hypothetical protein
MVNWYNKLWDIVPLIVLGGLGFLLKYLFGRTVKAYESIHDKAFSDRFDLEILKYDNRIKSLESDIKILNEDKKIKEAVLRALDEKQYKNGL